MAKYTKQVVAFIDFLGISEAALRADENLTTKVVDVLTAISDMRGDFGTQVTRIGGASDFLIRPAISTFSDHVVISYDVTTVVAAMRQMAPSASEPAALMTIYNILPQFIGWIARAALGIGFLIRGGVSLGRLHHEQGVVFGEAMVEAYNLESQRAKYPRVVVSQGAIESNPQLFRFRKDKDDLTIVDFCPWIVVGPGLPSPYGGGFKELEIIATGRRTIADQKAELRSNSKLYELEKWEWFEAEFEFALTRLNPQLRKQIPPNPYE